METGKALACWIGHTDLRSMGDDLGGTARSAVVDAIGGWDTTKQRSGVGPIRSLVDKIPFARIDILSNYPENVAFMYRDWLGQDEVHVHSVRLDDPTSYPHVFALSDTFFGECWERSRKHGWTLCIHLSPGTPTMAAVSVLLGKTKYPAKLYQTHRETVREEDLPFEIDLFVMNAFKDPDRLLANAALSSPGEVEGFEEIVGESRAIREAVNRAQRVALRDINVLLTGETGTGKEMFARAIHKASRRRNKPFVALNCAALPGQLFESEVFGYYKGAFTDAKEDRAGAFEQADGGVLFLDEIGELSPESQAKLLRALQPAPGDPPCACTIRRLGASRETKTNVRVIAATRRSLLDQDRRQPFRDDLYYRLATVTLELPSLRERQSDIRLLTQAFMADLNRRFARDEPGYRDKVVSAEVQRILNRHRWPGNVRELRNILVQASIMSEGDCITRRDIEQGLSQSMLRTSESAVSFDRQEGFRLEQRIDEIRRKFVADALEDADGKNNAAATLLGISPSTMSKYCRKYGLSLK